MGKRLEHCTKRQLKLHRFLNQQELAEKPFGTIITVLASVIVETLWVPFLRERLLEVRSIEKEMREAGYRPSS
ncbi:hypothetical protein E3E26_05545 [Thermococcus sp. LS1]|uniref:hypothetical protein n=1 Tax=Thermococcus sp. LS1 TaxID=1638259 RepID=UPI00143B77B0|nr:hypothetical protein [Thermococcus sp. LS1]NJD99245.1 hypothetical protein [Thermococcus sp. LS1]